MRTLCAIFCLAAGAVAGEQPNIRVDVNLVNIAFTVRDARGALAAELNKEPGAFSRPGVYIVGREAAGSERGVAIRPLLRPSRRVYARLRNASTAYCSGACRIGI